MRAITLAERSGSSVAELAGEVRPRLETRAGFQIGGRISARLVDIGDRVSQGQVLATLDPQDYQLALQAARAQLNAARIDYEQQRADYQRFEELRAREFISEAELQRRRSALEAAQARLKQAQAQAEVSGNQADYASLRAPTVGVITAVDAEVGQVVAPGQSVLRLAQSSAKEVAVAIPEGRLQQLKSQREVRVSIWSLPGEFKGVVREVAPIADPATRTYPARITLVDAPAAVALGMTATVRFEQPLPQPILTVPLTALLQEGGATYVWKLDRTQMTVSKAAVQPVNVAGNEVVLGAGVQAGDTVVTAGVHLLQPGQKVKLLEAQGGVAAQPPAGAAEPGKAVAAANAKRKD